MERLTDENFDQFLEKSKKKPVLVDFWALWCHPCAILSPILEELEKEFKEKIIFAQVNVDGAPKTSTKYRITQIPAVFLFYNKKIKSGFLGTKPKEQIRDWLKRELEEIEEKEEKIEKICQKLQIEETLKWYQEYAKKQGFKLNPEKSVVISIINGLLNNEKKYGARYCPCQRITGDFEKDRPKICPCSFSKKEIEEKGHCLCGLFWKKEA